MNKFDRYKSLKNQFNLVYKGVHLNRVLALMIWFMANSKEAGFKWRTTAKLFFAVDVRKLNFDSKIHTILTTFGDWSRSEHLKLYENIIYRLGTSAAYNEISELGHKFCFSVASVANFIKSLGLLRRADLTFTQKWKLSVHATYYCNTIDLLERQNLWPRKYLCMSHVLGIDNLLTQYFKLKEVPTYSLQEGIYFLYGENPPLDSILYENFETDNLLCWGQYTIDEYKKYGIDKHRMSISGYPKDITSADFRSKNNFRKCIVFLARESFTSSNMRLLKLLSNYTRKYDFFLKLHPSCSLETYRKLAVENNMSIIPTDKLIDDCLNNVDYDFSIAVNTTVYYEALMRGLPCLRFHDEAFILMTGLDDVFTDREQFVLMVDVLQNIASSAYKEHVKELLEYVIGYGLDNYMESMKCEI